MYCRETAALSCPTISRSQTTETCLVISVATTEPGGWISLPSGDLRSDTFRLGEFAIKLEHISTWIAVAICGIQIAATQALASAELPPRTSPVEQEPLGRPTPFPTSPVTAVPKLSEKKTATTSTALNSFLKHESFGVVNLQQVSFDSDPKRLAINVEVNRVSASLEVDTVREEPSLHKVA